MVGGAILSRMTAVNWSRDGGHQDDQQHPLTLWPVRNLIDAVDGAACPPFQAVIYELGTCWWCSALMMDFPNGIKDL